MVRRVAWGGGEGGCVTITSGVEVLPPGRVSALVEGSDRQTGGRMERARVGIRDGMVVIRTSDGRDGRRGACELSVVCNQKYERKERTEMERNRI